jgi:hypothetical protein
MPSGVVNSGSRDWPSVMENEQRRAISTLLASACGRSAKSRDISSRVLKYCAGVKRRTRRGLARISPSAMQTRASWAR